MSADQPSLGSRYFDQVYAGSADPWGFRTSPYERDKYAATIAVLPRPRYHAALEVGCSIGVFTRLLAARCDEVLALDTAARALVDARRDNADLHHVVFREATLPHDFPAGFYDLIVLSEMLYYLSVSDLRDLALRCRGAMTPDGHMVLCHWLGETDYPLGGDEAAELFIAAAAPSWRRTAGRREPRYRLDLLTPGA